MKKCCLLFVTIALLIGSISADDFRDGTLSDHVYKYGTSIPLEDIRVYFQEYEVNKMILITLSNVE